MIVIQLQIYFGRKYIISSNLDSQHFVAGRSLGNSFFHLAQEHLDILIAYINSELKIVAYFLLFTALELVENAEVLDGIAPTHYELIGMALCELHGVDVKREVTLLAPFELSRHGVLHCEVQTNKWRELLREGDARDIVSRRGGWQVGLHIAHKANGLILYAICRYPS